MAATSTTNANLLDAARTSGVLRVAARADGLAPSAVTAAPVSRDGLAVRDNDEDVIGRASGLADVIARLEQVAPTDAPVLLEGETGSGKELLSRLVHQKSRRADGPMIRVNCGAIPAELVDSELFGHERGSFTGATTTHRGWFERADGGTLFLDEVAELPPAAQVRLLRVLQEGTFTRVGGQKPLEVSVRIVTATHRDLRAMCATGAFRSDLWYRIGVFSVKIPPLRARPEDIRPLAEHFARASGIRLTGVPLVPSEEALERLLAYAWPGNVRELAAVIERAAILGGGLRLDIAAALGESLPAVDRRIEGPDIAARNGDAPALAAGDDRVVSRADRAAFTTLDDAIRAHIARALTRAGGRIEGKNGAADLLGVNPHSLRGKMRKLRIDWSRYRAR